MYKLDVSASVVDMSFARDVMGSIGLRFKRVDNDTMEVLDDGGKLGSLYVDEGCFSDTLNVTGLEFSRPHQELVDFKEMLRLMVKKINEDFKPEPSPFSGRGRTARHYITQYYNELVRLAPANVILDHRPRD